VRKKETGTAIGRAGEEAAALYLAAHGYRVRERNVRFRSGEIDMVAEEAGVLVFIEVKTRTGPGFGTAAEAVTARKQQQLVRLAGLYLAIRGGADQACRFDVVTVAPAPDGTWSCTLIPDAFCAR
jgi:putative endonuclease